MKVYGELEFAQFENSAGNPTTGLATGRAIIDTSTGTCKYYNGTGWITFATGSGGSSGGGSSIAWSNEGPNAAMLQIENGNLVYLFGSGLSQILRTSLIAPQSLVSGSPITVYVGAYSPSTTNNFLVTATSYLVRKDSDAVTSTTLSRVTTNTALTNTVANMHRRIALDITDTAGKIGGTLVSPGDLINIILTRGTDTDTGDVRLSASGTEVKFT